MEVHAAVGEKPGVPLGYTQLPCSRGLGGNLEMLHLGRSQGCP